MKQPTKDREMSMMEEVVLANERMLNEQSKLISNLFDRLTPIINNNRETGITMTEPGSDPGMYSPLTNTLMNQSDTISSNNRMVRRLMEMLEI